MQTPQEFHESNHDWTGVDFRSCFHCGRARSVCRRKMSFRTEWDAWVEARLLNEESDYVRPLYPYRCRWCWRWHHTSTADNFRRVRMEQRRRKWLWKQRELREWLTRHHPDGIIEGYVPLRKKE